MDSLLVAEHKRNGENEKEKNKDKEKKITHASNWLFFMPHDVQALFFHFFTAPFATNYPVEW
jgi:hypothetical protein